LGNPHRQSGGYNMLRMIAHAHGELKEAFNLAYIGGTNARFARLENSVALSLLWQGVYAQYLNEPDRAKVLHYQGKDHHERFNLKPLPEYYNAVCEYLELTGAIQEALDLRKQQLDDISEVGSVNYTASSHL